MLHRDKHIGKSLYRIVKNPGEPFRIMEIFNDGKTFSKAYSHETFELFDDAAAVLTTISRERYYTDPYLSGGFNV